MSFELGVGHYVDGKRWSELLREYNLLEGRSGGLVLVWTVAGAERRQAPPSIASEDGRLAAALSRKRTRRVASSSLLASKAG